MVHCTQCGHKLPGDAWLCTECGSFQDEPSFAPKLATGSAETPTPEPITATRPDLDSRRLAGSLLVCCTQCGHKLPSDAWLCTECGSFQNDPAAPESRHIARGTADTPTPQSITVAALPTDLTETMTTGWHRLVSILSGSFTKAD